MFLDPGGDEFTPGDPAHGVCIAFDDGALVADPTWTRLDDPAGYRLATGWSISRGRVSEFDKTGTGTAEVTFVDTNGVLDSTNSFSPFFDDMEGATKINPMKQGSIALMNPMTGDWTTLYRGFLSSVNHSIDMWTDVRGIDTVTMNFADAFDLLGAVELTPDEHGDVTVVSGFGDVYYGGQPPNYSGEVGIFVHVDDRLMQLLDDAGWPNSGKRAGLRNIFSGNVSLQGSTYSRRDSLLSALFDAADAEFPGVANIFASKTGVVTFHGRYARFFPARAGYGINFWRAGGVAQAAEDDEVAPITGLEYRRSKDDIINACLATFQHIPDRLVTGQLVKDTTSIGKYGWRSLSFENLITHLGHDDDLNPTGADVETKKFAEYYVGNYKNPRDRVSQLKFRPRGEGQIGALALWALMCGVEIGDVITLETVHPGGDGGFNEDFFVEGIHYEASPARVDMHDITMTLDVSPRGFFDYNPFGNYDDSGE